MASILLIDSPTIIDISFGVSFIITGFAITGYLIHFFYSKKAQASRKQ